MQTERQPLYMQIQQYFKDLIAEGKLKENDKIPSEKELMEQFDVSRITVANALVQLAKDGWIYRIPGRGSFVSEGIERMLAGQPPAGDAEPRQSAARPGASGYGGWPGAVSSSGLRTIGLLLPELVDHFALRLVQGINRVLEGENYQLHIIVTGNSIDREKEAIGHMIRSGADGLLIFPCDAETYNEEILSLKAAGYPFVLVDRYLPGIETNVVRSDGLVGGRMAVDYLWELGHRDIAICSDSILPTITVEDRINGYIEALKRRGAMINPALILTDFNVDYHKSDEDHPLYRFIKNRMATAYVTLNGRLGVHIASICRKLGLRVPQDVSILTFDDPASGLGEEGEYSHISQSEGLMGEQAARILLDMLASGKEPGAGGYSKIIMEPQLVVRRSTGPVCK
ncbi:GntR family transcriptional regulator [Cohnella thermotolerans]|uniref:GntR family transcriptional regulator n=1 Tax=Cohnella thermotolerans TaxID=329858 RepID=UPI000410E6E3|nr:substrate-binding domain-containing protein [Cohnella thermotolerans]